MSTKTAGLARVAAATALTVAVLVGSVGTANAAANRGDGPKTDDQKALDDACQTAFDTLEWAKTKRQHPDDLYDRIANGAFWFLDNFCDGADYDSSAAPAPGPTTIATTQAALDQAEAVAGIEPMDNPVPALSIEPMDNPIIWFAR